MSTLCGQAAKPLATLGVSVFKHAELVEGARGMRELVLRHGSKRIHAANDFVVHVHRLGARQGLDVVGEGRASDPS